MRTGRPSTKRFIYTAPAREKMLRFISDWSIASGKSKSKNDLAHEAELQTKKSRDWSYSFEKLLNRTEGKIDVELQKAWENIQRETKKLRSETQIVSWERTYIEELDLTPRVNLFLTEHTNRARANFVGRNEALTRLEEAWNHPTEFILTIQAWGGMGKSSAVRKWLGHLATRHYDGAHVFGWTFNHHASGGTPTTSNEFIQSALKSLGDEDPTKGKPVEQSLRLVQLVRSKRTLLFLDSVEMFQASHDEDSALSVLLTGIAAHNPGLCVITTRTPIRALASWQNTTAPLYELPPLSQTEGAQLLWDLEVRKGTQTQREQAAREMGGHPLALTLLGNYLSEVHGGDVTARHDVTRQSVPLLDQDEADGGEAIRMLAFYEKLLGEGPDLSVLRLIGLFAHPVKREVIASLLQPPVIAGLTDALVDQTTANRKRTLARLRRYSLLDGQASDDDDLLDTHPLIRQFFGRRMCEKQSTAWKAAHSRLFDYFSQVTPECPEFPETLETMAPLFAAVAHGCAAGRYQEALEEIYVRRICRGDKNFNLHTLGAYGPSLGAMSHFFDDPIHLDHVTDALDLNEKAEVLSETGFTLRASGHLTRAIGPFEASLSIVAEQDHSQESLSDAASDAGNLSELFLNLGNLPQALSYARRGVEFADRSRKMKQQSTKRTTLANTLNWMGQTLEAQALFQEAEAIQFERSQAEPITPLLHAVGGYWYCDLLLEQGQYEEVQRRVSLTLEVARSEQWQLATGLDLLSLGRAQMAAELSQGTSNFTQARENSNKAIAALWESHTDYYMPSGLLARAALYRIEGNLPDAKRDLDQAWSLSAAEMKLHQLSCHLEFARWHKDNGDLIQARTSLNAAQDLIRRTQCYRRQRDVEVIESGLNSM